MSTAYRLGLQDAPSLRFFGVHRPMQANDGSMIRLSDLVDVSPVVLFFYPKVGHA